LPETLENIVVVLSIGQTGFGNDVPKEDKHPAFWPIGNMTAVENLIDGFAEQGVKHFVLTYSKSQSSLIQSQNFKALDIKYIENELPRGSAGCIKDALNIYPDKTAIFLPANCTLVPDLSKIMSKHNQSILSLFTSGFQKKQSILPLFICHPKISKYIPDEGYYDVKEWLISELLKADEKTNLIQSDLILGHFMKTSEYLKAVKQVFQQENTLPRCIEFYSRLQNQNIWIGPNVSIDPTARIIPPVIIGKNTMIKKETVIIGPSIIGDNCTIEKQSIISESIISDNTKIASRCSIQDSAFLTGKIIKSDYKKNKTVNVQTYLRNKKKSDGNSTTPRFSPVFIAASVILFIAFVWSYFNPTISDLLYIWTNSDEFSSGLLVPLLAGYIFWSRRKVISKYKISPAIFSGICFFLLAQTFRFLGLYYMFGSAEKISLIVSMYAVVLLITGWEFCWKNKSILLFLLLMLPFPSRIQSAITAPLQQWSTVSAVFGLEMLGYEVTRNGNVIDINGTRVAVAEACNGLRMLMAFIVISGLMALVINRKWWEKLIILASSIPVALVCNTIRLIVTSTAFTIIDADEWEKAFHDFGGYAMMPLAIGMILLELWFLSALFIDNKPQAIQQNVVSRKK